MDRKQEQNRIPENDPSKAMDSKREVEQSKDPRTDQDFPGYPHYPAKEDIMDQRTDMHRVDLDVENLASGPNRSGINQRFADTADKEKEGLQPSSSGGDPDAVNDETGVPQNVSNEDNTRNTPGTDLDESMKRGQGQ